MIINQPDITLNSQCCIYKFEFPDGTFYIGSTVNLKRRIGQYKKAFRSFTNVNKLICRKLDQFDEVTFSILAIVDDCGKLKQVENQYITKMYCDKILNRSASAFGNSRMIKNDPRFLM